VLNRQIRIWYIWVRAGTGINSEDGISRSFYWLQLAKIVKHDLLWFNES
jgi:hypothetical protein